MSHKKPHFWRLKKPPNSTCNVPSSQGPSQVAACDAIPNIETSGNTLRQALSRMGHIFHRSNLSHPGPAVATEVANAATGRDAGRDPREQLDPIPNQQTQEAAENEGSESVLAVAGRKVDAATKAFDEIDPISRISKAAINLAGGVDTGFTEIQNFSERYFQPFKVFNQVVTTLANVSF
ncbi:hypothetical protein EDD17DRAFT_94304 [Pisolithus thermaeus]|nr:hypothetical protein EDD17DRAFT_94304 [Pisolithus thermaeus]